MSNLKIFTEKEIRKQILRKIDPQNINKSGAHWIGEIYSNGKLVGKITIPNEHNKDMFHNKTKRIAQSLLITHDQFQDLIKCTMSGKDYYQTLTDSFK
jgi:hypothetical protein